MRVFIKSIYDERGHSIFPEKLSDEKLKSLRAKIGSTDFSALYELKVISDTEADFKKEDLKTFVSLPKGDYATFLLIDLGGTDELKNDATGFVIIKVDRDDNWFISSAERFWGSILEIDRKIFELYNIWTPKKIGVEREKYSIALMPILKQDMLARNIHLPVEELKIKIGNRRSMRDRILSLQGRWESHKLFIQEGLTDLIDEFLRFPRGRFDDLISALSYGNVICHRPKKTIKKRDPRLSPLWGLTRQFSRLR